MANYFMQEMPDIRKKGETILYPRIKITGICEMAELVERGIKGSTFGKGEVMGALSLISDEMVRVMSEGRSVRIDGIGLFTPTLILKKGKERENIDGKSPRRNASSLKVGGIKFRADKYLTILTSQNCELERLPEIRRCKVSKYSAEERLSILYEYLDKHPFITIREYSQISGLSKWYAGRELREFTDNSEYGILYVGKGSHKLYIKKRL